MVSPWPLIHQLVEAPRLMMSWLPVMRPWDPAARVTVPEVTVTFSFCPFTVTLVPAAADVTASVGPVRVIASPAASDTVFHPEVIAAVAFAANAIVSPLTFSTFPTPLTVTVPPEVVRVSPLPFRVNTSNPPVALITLLFPVKPAKSPGPPRLMILNEPARLNAVLADARMVSWLPMTGYPAPPAGPRYTPV